MNIAPQTKVILNNVQDILLVLCTLHLALGTAFADTTFVSGAVSGEWTRDGNPYIVVDSTWVPEGERLTLTAGVRLFFQEEQGLDVFGTLRVVGSDAANLVEIRVLPGVTDWKGVNLHGQNETVWDYAWVQCPKRGFLLSPRYTVTMNNCGMEITGRAFQGNSENHEDIEGCSLTFNRSRILGGMYIVTIGGTISADHTTFDFSVGDTFDLPGFNGEGTNFLLTHCTVYGGLANDLGTIIVEYCRFLKPVQRSIIFASVSGENGRMIGTFVDGGSGVNNLRGNRVVRYEDNTVTGNCGFSGKVAAKRCDIRGGMFVMGTVSISNSTLSRRLNFDNFSNSDTLRIDSCALIYDYFNGFNTLTARGDEAESNLVVTRSFLKCKIDVSTGHGLCIIDHNIFMFDSSHIANPTISAGENSYWTNNVFLTQYDEQTLFSGYQNPELKYNCVWGFEQVAGDPDSVKFDSTNLIADPEFEWYGFMPLLSQGSACIDRGDPQAPRDPDGTRSDIGNRYFHQESSVFHDPPPIFDFQLSAFPNPFNSSTTISFGLDKSAPVRLAIYNLSGRLVADLLNRRGVLQYAPTSSPTCTVTWNAASVPAGVYLYRVETGQFQQSAKLLLLR